MRSSWLPAGVQDPFDIDVHLNSSGCPLKASPDFSDVGALFVKIAVHSTVEIVV